MSEAILVVGGAGYVGSHVAKLLARRGYQPVVLDDLSTGHRAAARFGPFHQGSYDDEALVADLLTRHGIGTVLHFGARSLVPESVAQPGLYYEANVAGTLRLLRGMQRAGATDFLFSSTCAVFGAPDEMPIHERVAQRPLNPYGRSKLFVEEILRDLEGVGQVRAALLRYFNAAGADLDGELGEDHRPETHLIPRVLMAATGALDSLVVYGNQYPTPDGTCLRDYVHVDDLADAHVRAMEHLRSAGTGFDVNLGTTRGYSVLEVVAAVEQVTGRRVPVEIGQPRAGDPPLLVADGAKAQALIGWRPQHGLDVIVDSAARWMREHPGGFAD